MRLFGLVPLHEISNTVFILSAGQIVLETEIFSFLPRPGVSYTLIARLGGSGITFDPIQFTF